MRKVRKDTPQLNLGAGGAIKKRCFANCIRNAHLKIPAVEVEPNPT
jgi:hypothetical protein